ncbi:unnamed protein product [Leptosia nina]|uniref:Cyclin N-terminal domain-containing protein n=1 Tax=Leptosia nina TaxID=320188 RepID=A0AAV1JZC3_9NEOP
MEHANQSMPNTINQQDENKSQSKVVLPKGKTSMTRGVLGEVHPNVQCQRDISKKATIPDAECEKNPLKAVKQRTYRYVQAKVDTGLGAKSIPTSSRPSLQATCAAMPTRNAVKEDLKKDIEIESNKVLKQVKRSRDQKNLKLNPIKEISEEEKNRIIKDPTEPLGKLKLAETEIFVEPLMVPILTQDIEEMDASDPNPRLTSIYIKDIYKHLTTLEKRYPIVKNHLKNQNEIKGHMRALLIDWLAKLQCAFSLLPETLHLAVGIIDRYLQVIPNVPKNRLQLIGVTAIFIASKYQEIYPLHVTALVRVTNLAYTENKILTCEEKIKAKLNLDLARHATPLSFIRGFIKVAHGAAKNHHLAKYFVDLCLVEYSMAHYKPSELAAAAVCLSLHILPGTPLQDVWTRTLAYYSGYELAHIRPILRKIATLVINVDKSKYKAVLKKYSHVTMAKVATLPHLKRRAMFKLAQRPSSISHVVNPNDTALALNAFRHILANSFADSPLGEQFYSPSGVVRRVELLSERGEVKNINCAESNSAKLWKLSKSRILPKEINRRRFNLLNLSEIEFKSRFRPSKSAFKFLCAELHQKTSIKSTKRIGLEEKICDSDDSDDTITDTNPECECKVWWSYARCNNTWDGTKVRQIIFCKSYTETMDKFGGYPQRPCFMTPIPNETIEGSPEALYTSVHEKARVVIENTFGRPKNRWRCL